MPAEPQIGGGRTRIPPIAEPPGRQGGRPVLGIPNRMSPRGVIGGSGFTGPGGVGAEAPLAFDTAGEPRPVPPGGVLRNGSLHAANEGASASLAEARQGAVGTGIPMTGGLGNGNGTRERTRDVYAAEDNTLWEDETEFSPRVLGNPDRTTRNI
ncbi:hypothetical protein ACTIVE_3381 [Actinomadura verrucosospora]|uniref:Uncharacterized protein n=1 Tax=Actinomadura verrucosospora TaxID=46165 RepID=A0A7D3ZLW3_ACTVE|nr:hypothetical protein ACTIVE_3381 [Actinomadura verrucosospora]